MLNIFIRIITLYYHPYCIATIILFPFLLNSLIFPLTEYTHTKKKKKRKNLANKDHSIIPNFLINVYRKTVTTTQTFNSTQPNPNESQPPSPLASPFHELETFIDVFSTWNRRTISISP